MGFQTQENPSYKEFPFLLFLIPRHHSRPPAIHPIILLSYPLPSFFSHTCHPTNTPLLKQGRILHHKQPPPPRDRIERPVQVIPRQLRNVPHQESRQQIHSTHHASPHHTLHITFNHRLVSPQTSHDSLRHPLGRQQSSTVSARRIEDRRLRGTFSSTLPSYPTRTHDVDKHTEGLENHAQCYGTPPSNHPHSPKA